MIKDKEEPPETKHYVCYGCGLNDPCRLESCALNKPTSCPHWDEEHPDIDKYCEWEEEK